MRATFFCFMWIFMGVLIGNKIGFEAAKTKYYGAQQEANWRYGCSIKQQMPSGDCP